MVYILNNKISVFTFSVFYMSSLLQHAACISTNNNKQPVYYVSNSNDAVASLIFNASSDHFSARNRRKLSNGSDSDDEEQNSLDESGVQYQEYQGVFGRPGIDFPVLPNIPITKFNCRDVKNSNSGYYADLETNCQVFHVCNGGQKVSFLCPNGTIFRQSHLICDWWFRVECQKAPDQYEQSVQHLKADQGLFKQRAETIQNAMQDALSKGMKSPVLLESPVSVTNEIKAANYNFNSESDLPQSYYRPNPPQTNRDHFQSLNKDDSSQGSNSYRQNELKYPATKPNIIESFSQNSNNNPNEGVESRLSLESQSRSSLQNHNNFYTFDQSQTNWSPFSDFQQKQRDSITTNDDYKYKTLPISDFENINQDGSGVAQAYNLPEFLETLKEHPKVNPDQQRNYGQNPTQDVSLSFRPEKPQITDQQPFQNQKLNPFETTGIQQDLIEQQFENTPVALRGNSFSSNSPLRVQHSFNKKTNINSIQQQHPKPKNVPGVYTDAFHNPESEIYQTHHQQSQFNDKNKSSKTYSIGLNLEPPNLPSKYFQPPYPNLELQETLFPIDKPTVSTNSKNNQFSTSALRLTTWSIPQTKNTQTTLSTTPVTFTQSPSSFVETLSLKNSFTFDTNNNAAKFFSITETPIINSISNSSSAPQKPVTPTLPTTTYRTTSSLNLLETTTPSITNFVKSYFENQVPAETASFTNNGKIQSMQKFYYSHNSVTPQLKIRGIQSRPTLTTPSEPTTFNLYNSLFDSAPSNISDIFSFHNNNLFDVPSSLTTQTEESPTWKPSITIKSETEITELPTAETLLPVLVTNETKFSYNQLFFRDPDVTTKSSILKTKLPQYNPSSLTTQSIYEKLNLSSSPNFRELAQIFSRALSAYLDDPEQFRKILLEVRPTEPSVMSNQDFEDESLSFSDVRRTTPRPITTSNMGNTETFAAEVNNFMYEDNFESHTDNGVFNVNETYYPGLYNTNPTTPITVSVAPIIDLSKTSTREETKFQYQKNSGFSDQVPYKVDFKVSQDESTQVPLIAPETFLKLETSGYFGDQASASKTKSYLDSFNFTSSQTTTPIYPTTFNDFLNTSFSISSDSGQIVLSDRTIHAMMNMLENTYMDQELKNKLILLLVNDGSGFPLDSQSYKEMKSKLLKALIVPTSTNDYKDENSISRRKARKGNQVSQTSYAPTVPTRGHARYRTSTNPPSQYFSQTQNSVPQSSKLSANSPSPTKQIESNGLVNTDIRAVDLLKTLYSIAARN